MKKAFFVSCLASGLQAIKLSTSTSAYAELLAQMKTYKDYATCTVTADRVKVGEENMKAMNDSASSGKAFTDYAFPRNEASIYWQGHDKPKEDDIPKADTLAAMKYTRLSEDPNLKGAKLYGENGIRPVDIN